MRGMTVMTIACAAGCWMASEGASAAGGYASASLVRSQFDSRASTDQFGLGGAFRFNDRLAVEFSWLDLGDWSWLESCGVEVCFPEDATTFRMDAMRFDLAFIGTVPLGSRLKVYGKVGAARTMTRLRGIHMLAGPYLDERDGEVGAVLGVGGELRLWSRWSAHLQWDRVDSGLGDTSAVWAGARYSFGR